MKAVRYIVQLILIVTIVLIALSQTNIGNYPANKGDHNYINIQGNKIRYSQSGEGRDLLLIHGTPGFLEDWNAIAAELAKDYRVTCYDRMGHGYSEQSPPLQSA